MIYIHYHLLKKKHALKKNHYSFQKIGKKHFHICTLENYVFPEGHISSNQNKAKALSKTMASKLHTDTEKLLNDTDS